MTTYNEVIHGRGLRCDNEDLYCNNEQYYCDGSVVLKQTIDALDVTYNSTTTTTTTYNNVEY